MDLRIAPFLSRGHGTLRIPDTSGGVAFFDDYTHYTSHSIAPGALPHSPGTSKVAITIEVVVSTEVAGWLRITVGSSTPSNAAYSPHNLNDHAASAALVLRS